jgi:hypothetical protein
MSYSSERKLVVVAGWGFVLTGAILISQRTLLADEPKSADGVANPCQVQVRGMPILEQIPLVKYFIKPVTDDSTTCTAATDQFERIGVDFDLLPGHVEFLPHWEHVICTENGCVVCPQQNACFAARIAAQHCGACADSNCTSEATGTAVAANHEAKPVTPADGHVRLKMACEGNPHHAACQHVAALQAENAALHAARATSESMLMARSELFEALLGLSVEKARLEARLELIAERDRMREEMLAMQSEIHKLKAAAELAETRQKLIAESMEVALENERLKLRIAELEKGESAPIASKAKKGSQVK